MASTHPATSKPGTLCLGLGSPYRMWATYGRPWTVSQSPFPTAAAWTRTSTASSVTTGVSMSLSRRASGGPEGSKVEVFGPDSAINRHFTTGPVAGFLVDDIRTATAELRSAGVEILFESGLDDSGNAWVHFRAPDGNIYEFTQDPGISRPYERGPRRPPVGDPGPAVVTYAWVGRRSTLRRSWALRATTMVDRLISTAPTAGARVIPAQASTPAARGTASRL